MKMKTVAEQIFLSGVESVLPDKLIRSQVRLTDGILYVPESEFSLRNFEHIYVIAVGKAGALMAKEMELILGDNITDGLTVVKYGYGAELQKLRLIEAGHPIPDQNGFEATKRILSIANRAGERDLVICLISGGASSLMADFPEGATLDDLVSANELLVKCGADIKETNTVRKHLSKVKGGQLAKAIYPATTVSLILSDVIGNPVDVIASGPTCGDQSTFADAFEVIKKYRLLEKLPSVMTQYIQAGVAGLIPETPKPDDFVFSKTQNIIIGSNKMALQAARRKAEELGYSSYIISDGLEGDYIQVAQYVLETTDEYRNRFKGIRPTCLLFSGEPTVRVTGTGLGGRNQHLALYCATKLAGKQDITVLCAGTDGTDGPTDAAGAEVDCNTCENALANHLDPEDYLKNSDSYHFFKQLGGHIMTGSTRTNVMDLIVVIIE